MFESLKKHDVILVTGPQRSGTTICARMIAHDTGHTYIDEARFGIWDGKKAVSIAKVNKPCVIQGPGLLKRASFPFFDAVVLMRRNVGEIAASLERSPEVYSRLVVEYPEILWCTSRKRHLPVLMYTVFCHCARDRIKNLVRIKYDTLDQHPLWVPKEERIEWTRRQWKN